MTNDLPRLPGPAHRTVVLGRTGSGKTQGAVGIVLANANWTSQPWIIVDVKGDELIEDIRDENNIPIIRPNDPLPKRPGLYWMRVIPQVDDEAMENFYYRVWKTGGIGLYIDEGYVIPPRSRWFNIILTQGRTLKIPVIVLYQAPRFLTIFATAQADFFMCFQQNKVEDQKKTADLITPATLSSGQLITPYSQLDDYHCIWHDVSRGKSHVLSSGPSRAEILDRFGERLSARRRANIR